MRRTAGPARAAEWAHKGAEEVALPPLVDPGRERSGGSLGPLEPEPEPAGTGKVERVAPKKASGVETLRVPIDPVNEQVLIAVAAVSPEHRARLVAQFPPDAFFAKGHPEIWAAFGELERQKLQYDPATMKLVSGGAVDTEYLELLVRQRPEVPPNLARHIEALKWDRQKLEISRGPLAALLETLRDPAANPERLRVLASQIGAGFSMTGGSGAHVRDPANLVREAEALLDERERGIAIYPYGIQGLDGEGADVRMIPGMAPKKITLLVGVSSSGKTSTSLEIVLAQVHMKRRVLLGAWENGSVETLNLLAARAIGMSRTRLFTGKFQGPQERKDLRDAMEWILEYVRFFDHPAATNRAAFRASVERQAGRQRDRSLANEVSLGTVEATIAETGAEVFVGDLWKRVLRTSDPNEEEQVLYATQDLAKRTDAHFLLLHQINLKELEKEADKRPRRELIKGNGAWVEVPDAVIAPYRPAQFKNVADETMQYFVLKQRYGRSPFVIECKYDPDTGRVWEGREIAYQPVGDGTEVDSWLNDGPQRPKRGRGRS